MGAPDLNKPKKVLPGTSDKKPGFSEKTRLLNSQLLFRSISRVWFSLGANLTQAAVKSQRMQNNLRGQASQG
jgi:hypothetical protein